jgi:Ser/Thr protein kinase RdoA (MazF antagonist)
VFVRSSASHVFLAGDSGGQIVLRMAPLGTRQADDVAKSATTAQTLAGLHAPLPPPGPSHAGRLVEVVDGMVVTALPRMPGTTYDDDELTAEQARLWGRTLARFHESGYVHGDPEPDNLVIDGDGDTSRAVFVDLDDAGPGDSVDDIAFALRAWTPPGGHPDLTAEIPAAFLAGYRDLRVLDLAGLPEAVRDVEDRTLASYQEHLTEPPDPDWPDWATALHDAIARRAAELTRPRS